MVFVYASTSHLVYGGGMTETRREEALQRLSMVGKGIQTPSLGDLVPGANLAGADLRERDLTGRDLSGCDLEGADLRGCLMQHAILDGANLAKAKLDVANAGSSSFRGAHLWRASATDANFTFANFGYASLPYINLCESRLTGANFHGADIYESYGWGDPCLQVTGLDSGPATFLPTWEGWRLQVGCWQGTLEDLEAIISGDDGWPEATPDQIPVRRPGLGFLLGLCRDHVERHPSAVADLGTAWCR